MILKIVGYRGKMFSKTHIHLNSTCRLNFEIIPNPFGIKMPNLTAPSELPQNPQVQFESYKKNGKFGLHPAKLVGPMFPQRWGSERVGAMGPCQSDGRSAGASLPSKAGFGRPRVPMFTANHCTLHIFPWLRPN